MPNTPDILKIIVARKQQEVISNAAEISLSKMQERSANAPILRDFVGAIERKLKAKKPAIIAEIKKASPSKGVLRENFFPSDIAKSYAKAGAACLSVLTDVDYFQGANQYLVEARESCDLPVIRKDFIIDPYQVYEARAIGADCILLIAAILEDNVLQNLSRLATDLKMAVLVEVHNEHELVKALKLDLPLLGINNRNLHDFTTRLQTSIELLELIPSGKIVVTESGILNTENVSLMQDHQINSFLVGEAFMRAEDPGQQLTKLFGEI